MTMSALVTTYHTVECLGGCGDLDKVLESVWELCGGSADIDMFWSQVNAFEDQCDVANPGMYDEQDP